MRSDCAGIGGFFEDLPVLAIIVSGLLMLMTTASWVGGMLESREDLQRIQNAAREITDRFLSSIGYDTVGIPMIDSLSGKCSNTSVTAPDDSINFILSVVELYPEWVFLFSLGICDDSPMIDVAFAMGHMNAFDSHGRIAMLEVRVLAW